MFKVGLFTIFEIKIEYISLEDNFSRDKIQARDDFGLSRSH